MGTDGPCKWDKPRKPSQPAKINSIDFRRNTATDQPSKARTTDFTPLHETQNFDVKDLERTVVDMLKEHAPQAVALHVLSDESDGSETDSDIENILPDMRHYKMQYDDLKCKDSVNSFLQSVVSEKVVKEIEQETKEQDANGEWMRQRVGRITASGAHSILHARPDTWINPRNYIVNNIICRSGFTSKPTQHGIASESVARQIYVTNQSKPHRNVTVESSGLMVSTKYPYLGASPDGIVKCSCCPNHVLEIKCPYAYKDKDIEFICSQRDYHLYKDNGRVLLKKTSPWFTQVQMQMYLANCDSCDLAVYTKVAPYLTIVKIAFDGEWWLKQLPVLEKFFMTLVWPRLA